MGMKQTYITGLTDLSATDKEGVGTIRRENAAAYKYVKFSGTTALHVGDVACYVAYASDGNAVIVDGANTAFGAGVVLVALGTGTVQYGWIQVRGLATLSTALSGSPTIGQALTTANAANYALDLGGTADGVVAWCYDATAKKVLCNFPC